jgi:hypothetical protein
MALLLFAAVAALAYTVVVAIYRIYFHPISHIPGPKWAAVTEWYQSYYDLWPHTGRFLWKTAELHEQYGPIIRIGPNEVQINDAQYYNEMYAPSGNRRREKSTIFFWTSAGWTPFASKLGGLPGELRQHMVPVFFHNLQESC